MKFIRYVILQTGLWHDFYESDVGLDAVEYCQTLIRQCLAHGSRSVPIALVEDYLLMAKQAGASLYGSIWCDQHSPEQIANFAISAGDDRELWRVLHERATLPPQTMPNACPAGPWIAISIEPGFAYHVETLEWLTPFGRCLAWAWLTGHRTLQGCARMTPILPE